MSELRDWRLAIERLRGRGVPEPMLEQLEFLFQELEGCLAAEGWDRPAAQARFLAGLLAHNASRFGELGGEEMDMPESEVENEREMVFTPEQEERIREIAKEIVGARMARIRERARMLKEYGLDGLPASES